MQCVGSWSLLYMSITHVEGFGQKGSEMAESAYSGRIINSCGWNCINENAKMGRYGFTQMTNVSKCDILFSYGYGFICLSPTVYACVPPFLLYRNSGYKDNR